MGDLFWSVTLIATSHNTLLVVVWFVFQNGKGSIELLGEDGTHYLVREGHLGVYAANLSAALTN